ncbi:MAG: exo-alpha-sialidase [Bacteroidales bacterium]|nr:exo-alpha-sialidase [Bacteroidales bacterium]
MKYLILALLMLPAVCGCHKPEIEEPDVPEEDSIVYYEQCLYRPGDYGSTNWRIPAICCLNDGTLLAVCDKRKYNESDLPEDIDIVVRRSTDNGRTWSEPLTIAEGTGRKQGFGDAALVECENGDVVCVFVGGNGLFASSQADPIRSYVCRSSDKGLSWSEPEDITFQLWGDQATRPMCRNYRASFFGSGNGLRLTRGEHAGRIMFAAAMVRKNSNVADNFVVYSDDNGMTWKVSQRAYEGGDEAKLMELVDGRVLISVRQTGARGYNYSSNGGLAWGTQGRWECMKSNACNGDMLRLAATDRGDSCNILLHSIPNSMERRDVSIYVSYDEGQTWQDPVLLFDGPSVYSSMTLLKNGSVGVLLEENPNGACELWYQNWPREMIVNR